MKNIIDGFSFDLPLVESQIVALAQYHRKQLDDAIFHEEIHLGKFSIAQRQAVFDYTQTLTPLQKQTFYAIYDGELKRLADDEDLHPADAESGISILVVVFSLILIALILYFTVLQIIIS